MSRRLLVALASLVLARAASAATLAERAAALDSPRLGAAVQLTAPLELGRGRIVPAATTKAFALVADGAACGILVDGPAKLEYRVEDPISLPVAARNLDRASKLATARDAGVLIVREDLDAAVIWGRGLPGGETAPVSAGSGAMPGWASKVLAARRFTPPSHGLLAEEANGGHGLRYALLAGRHGTLLLYVDPMETEEDLYRLQPSTDPGTSFRQGMHALELVAQPIGRRWWDPAPRALLAVHESLAVTNSDGERIHVTSTSRLRVDRAGVALWQPQLVSDLYGEDGRIRKVVTHAVKVDGRPADFLHEDGELLVALGAARRPGATVEVEVDYEGDLGHRPAGNSYWLLGTYPWYPRQDLGGELATMEIRVDVPAPLVPFASGAELQRTSTGPRRSVTTRIDQPAQFAVVLAGKYALVEETRADVTCRAATYALLNERGARELIAKFFSGIEYLEKLLDARYPYRNFTILEIASWGFGQAPPGVLFFTHEFYTAPMPGRIRGYFKGRDPRFLHEVAHGWWGNTAHMASWEELWWTEALADYTAALAFWQLRGTAGQQAFDDIVHDWAHDAAGLGPGASLYLQNRFAFADDRDADDSWRLRYAKGPLVVHAIRLELQKQKGSVQEGDRFFIAFLRAFLKRSSRGFGSTADMAKTLDELTGMDWQPFFERYVYGTEMPPLAPR